MKMNKKFVLNPTKRDPASPQVIGTSTRFAKANQDGRYGCSACTITASFPVEKAISHNTPKTSKIAANARFTYPGY